MELTLYKKQDAEYITKLIDSEEICYKWSADRLNKYPVTASDLNEMYDTISKITKFIPLTFNENGIPVGHLIIRYPEENNDKLVRFGFIIISPDLRGKGNGKKMLNIAIDYVKNNLKAKKITLGVFAQNFNALNCYKAVGFKITDKIEKYSVAIGEWDCIEMEMDL